MSKSNRTMLGIQVPKASKNEIREYIIKNIKHPASFFHIISLNPEIFVLAQKNEAFKKVITTAQLSIIDGFGVKVGAFLQSIPSGERYAGVDLMSDLLFEAQKRRLRVLLIGGGPKIAEKVVECQKKSYPGVEFFAIEGIFDISMPKKEEERKISAIVTAAKPHLVFVAFGSPWQELWIERHRSLFKNMVVMGVGGAFDFLSGSVRRAPQWMRSFGLEWLYRLVRQPWRASRQHRLLIFFWLVLKERFI